MIDQQWAINSCGKMRQHPLRPDDPTKTGCGVDVTSLWLKGPRHVGVAECRRPACVVLARDARIDGRQSR